MTVTRIDKFDRLVAIDFETTGRHPLKKEIIARQPRGWRAPGVVIEVGCVEMIRIPNSVGPVNWHKGGTYRSLVNPLAPVSQASVRIHGINPSRLQKAPRFSEIQNELLSFIGDALMIAHSRTSEHSYLNYEIARSANQRGNADSWDDDTYPLERFFCTQNMFSSLFPGTRASLDAVCDRLWIDRSDRFSAHGALLDADLTADVLNQLEAVSLGRIDAHSARSMAL